jgi:HK97 family phage portal protein
MWLFPKKTKRLSQREYSALQMKAALYAQAMNQGKLGQPQFTQFRGETLVKEGYQLNSVVYACVNRIARMFSSMEFQVVNRFGEVDEKHPLNKLFQRPNKRLSGSQFLETYAVYYWLLGNAYIDATVYNGDEITEMFLPKPYRIKCVPGIDYPERYDYDQNGNQTAKWHFDVMGDPDLTRSNDHMIMHSSTVNPLNNDDYYGMPPMEAAGYAIDQHNEYAKHNKALAENGMSPSGVFKYQPSEASGLDAEMPDDMYNRLKQMIRDNHKGGANAGNELILEGWLDYQQTGMTLREADFNESKLNVAREICTVFGVPFTLVVPGQSTYNNVKEAKEELALETVLPFARKFVSDFNNFISFVYGDEVMIREVETSIPSVRDAAVDLAVKVDTVQHMTINEKRKLSKLPEVDGGDEVLINAGLLPLGFEADDGEV